MAKTTSRHGKGAGGGSRAEIQFGEELKAELVKASEITGTNLSSLVCDLIKDCDPQNEGSIAYARAYFGGRKAKVESAS